MFQEMFLNFIFLQSAVISNKIDITLEVTLVDPEVNL